MGALGVITAFRKLRNFLVAMFPGLERLFASAELALNGIATRSPITRAWNRWRESRWGQLGERIVRNFWWSDYSKHRVDPGALPREAVVVLRFVFLLATALCLLLPLAMKYPGASIPAAAVSGAKEPVAYWSVLLWILCLVLGWSSLLAGSAISNRVALLLSVVLFLYFQGVAATALPRSGWNGIVPLLALTAAGMGEFRFGEQGRRINPASLAFCLVAGVAAGIVLVTLTPIAGAFPGHALAVGLVSGFLLCSLLLYSVDIISKNRQAAAAVNAAIRFDRMVAIFTSALLVYWSSLSARGGLACTASAVTDFLTVWSGYLWPLYYVIGVGVVSKVIGQAEFFTRTFQDLLPPRLYISVAAVLMLAAFLVAWSPAVLDTAALPWPESVTKLASFLYERSAHWIWSDYISGLTWEWLRWVLLFDVVMVVWLVVRRRLDTQGITSLAFGTLLIGCGIFEYMFQLSGISRTGTHSALVLFTFSIVILWLVHKVGLRFCAASSNNWPLTGRFGAYGGILLFVLLFLHVRASIHDTRIIGEISLYFFMGLTGFGLPYYLYVYASKRFQELPVRLPRLLGAFAFGAALTLPLIALDRLVAAGGSLPALLQSLSAQRDLIISAGVMPRESPALPPLWIVVRGAMVIGAWLMASRCFQPQAKQPGQAQAAMVFVFLAAAMGFASFSRTGIELPLLPLRLSLLLTPFAQSTDLDTNLMATYVTCGIPALVLGLTSQHMGRYKSLRFILGPVVAFLLYAALTLVWPAREAWLRSTGIYATGGLACILLLWSLLIAARKNVEAGLAPDGQYVAAQGEYVGHVGRLIITSVGLAVLTGTAIYQAYAGRGIARVVPHMVQSVPIPAGWKPVPSDASASSAAFTRSSFSPCPPRLQVEWKATGNDRPVDLLKSFVSSSSYALPGFAARRIEDWDARFLGARAVNFTFEQKLASRATVPVIGTRVVLPFPGAGQLTLTLVGSLNDWQAQHWDLVRIAESMRREAKLPSLERQMRQSPDPTVSDPRPVAISRTRTSTSPHAGGP